MQNGADTPLSPPLWDAAVGGYIEGVVVDDPESAAIAADLLQRESPVREGSDSVIPPGETRERDPDTSGETPSDVATSIPEQTTMFLFDPDNPDPLGLLLTAEERRARFPGDPGFPGMQGQVAREKAQ